MPIFVLHGFRFARTPILHHVILNNVDDVAPTTSCNQRLRTWLRGEENSPRLHYAIKDSGRTQSEFC